MVDMSKSSNTENKQTHAVFTAGFSNNQGFIILKFCDMLTQVTSELPPTITLILLLLSCKAR